MNTRASSFAVWRAAWRYFASWIERRVFGRGGVASVASAGRGERGRRIHREHVFAGFVSVSLRVKFPNTKAEEGKGGRESDFAPPFPSSSMVGNVEGTHMGWNEDIANEGIARPVKLADLGQRYRRYRLGDPDGEEAMAGSLRRWGQLAPVVACRRDAKLELLDGFKRLAAARQIGVVSPRATWKPI